MSASSLMSSRRTASTGIGGNAQKLSPSMKSQKVRNLAAIRDTEEQKRSEVRNGLVDGNQARKTRGIVPKSSPPRGHKQSSASARRPSPSQRRSSASVSSPSSSAVNGRRKRSAGSIREDIVFIDGDREKTGKDEGGVDESDGAARKPTGRIIPREIMAQSHESDVCKVYEIDLHAVNIGTICNLDPFLSLRVLDLSCNCIRNIENLANNKDLRDLKLYDNRITAIANIERLQELCSLQLQHNKIRTIGKGLALARKLKTLRLDSNYLGKIEARELAACSQLTYLDISSNKLDSLSALNALSALEELRATHNCLRAVTDLKRCRKLQELDISNNKIADITGLKGLHNLTVLTISHNQMTSQDFKGVDKLRALHTLDISYNKISDVGFVVDQFPSLEVLNVSCNRVTSWKSVLSLHRCEALSELYVQGNPFADPGGEKPSYHQELQATLLGLEILDGAVVKRTAGNKSAPVMRPMSASTIVSARQVENQLRNADQDLTSFMTNLSNRFANIRTELETLPSEPPRQRPLSSMSDDLTIRSFSSMSDGRPGSRCNSRSRIADAKAFATQNF